MYSGAEGAEGAEGPVEDSPPPPESSPFPPVLIAEDTLEERQSNIPTIAAMTFGSILYYFILTFFLLRD